MSDHAEPVNIGNPHEITISDFAEEIIKLTGTPATDLFSLLIIIGMVILSGWVVF